MKRRLSAMGWERDADKKEALGDGLGKRCE
jgi:hypothetical protein